MTRAAGPRGGARWGPSDGCGPVMRKRGRRGRRERMYMGPTLACGPLAISSTAFKTGEGLKINGLGR